MLLLAPTAVAQARSADLNILATADGEGHVGPCESCPAGVGDGGLARRATLIARLRLESPLLLVDAGNSLFGGDSAASKGKVIAAAYDALGYDAVNISYRDFRQGRQSVLALVREARFVALSANLLDDQTGQPLFKPYVVRDVAGQKIAILGVTESPAGLEFMPHLKEQLGGVRIRPVAEALAEWIPKAKAEAGQVTLLYYGSSAGLRAIQDKFGNDLTAVCVGGIRPGQLPQDPKRRVIASELHGKSLGRATLGENPSAVTQLAVSPDVASTEGMEKLLATFVPPALAVAPAGKDAGVTVPPLANQGAAPATAPAVTKVQTDVAMAVAPPPTPGVPATQTALPSPATNRASPHYTGPRVAARQPRQPRGLAGVGLTEQDVNTAIDRGADFLWKQLKAEQRKSKSKLGDGGGYDLLYSLALVKAGLHHREPDFDEQLRTLLAGVRPEQLGTYGCSVLCVLIEQYGDATFQPKLRLAVRFLLEGQGNLGSWDYHPIVPEQALADPASLKPVQVWGGVPLEGTNAERWKRVTPADKDHNGDNSVTQYGILGLDAASHCGVEVPVDVWKRVYELYRSRQADDGGWGYIGATSTCTGSMTCAGIFATALASYHSGEASAATDETVERGLGWLASHFTATDNPNSQGSWVYYYLYALERAGRTLDTEFIGEHEWYPLGAKFLVSRQGADGAWAPATEGRPEVSTSFALLFLSRGTATMGATRARGGKGTLKTALVEAPAPRLYLILDCSGSMLEEMGPKTKFDAARDAVSALVQDLPATTQIALRAYGHRKRAVDDGANEDTELLLPMAEVRPDVLGEALRRLRARGLTPLALSMKEAAKDLAGGGTEPVAVILLTDGGEDTQPRQDPVAATAELARVKNATLQIVGFDIGREDWGQQLRAMAAAGRGRYWSASDARELRLELRAAVLRTPAGFTILDAAGHPVATGTFGQSIPLPEGAYRFATSFAGKPFEEPFWINTQSTTAVFFDAGKIDFSPAAASASAAPAATAPSPHPDAAKPRFCTECGKPLPAGAKFCPNCGKPVDSH